MARELSIFAHCGMVNVGIYKASWYDQVVRLFLFHIAINCSASCWWTLWALATGELYYGCRWVDGVSRMPCSLEEGFLVQVRTFGTGQTWAPTLGTNLGFCRKHLGRYTLIMILVFVPDWQHAHLLGKELRIKCTDTMLYNVALISVQCHANEGVTWDDSDWDIRHD